ncbi:MAG: response regulator [Candidatus Omnitrophica bacterium]|nr:response regulator [Candidatus Omnitrophota bacterium]
MNGSAKSRILIIDDDPTIIKLTESILTTNGYETLTTSDAPIGLEMAMKEKVDLIILDVMLPIINGFNICRLLKSQEKYKMIPIILLTSRTEEEDRKIGYEVGADDYIAKPLNRENFLKIIADLLLKSQK